LLRWSVGTENQRVELSEESSAESCRSMFTVCLSAHHFALTYSLLPVNLLPRMITFQPTSGLRQNNYIKEEHLYAQII